MKYILEGFLGVGKTTFLSSQYNQESIFFEPHHQEYISTQDQEEISQWYLDTHRLRFTEFVSVDGNAILERSVLSSMAFQYAHQHHISPIRWQSSIQDMHDYQAGNGLLVIVLYTDYHLLPEYIKQVYSQQFFDRYMEFYRVHLPYIFGIVPTFIKVHDEEENRLTEEAINQHIQAIYSHNRIGQINIVLYHIIDNTPEFLVLQRNPQKGSFWQSITGGIHMQGSLQDNALRELREELSLDGNPEYLRQTEYVFCYCGGEGYELTEYVFGYEIQPEDSIALSDEHVAWEYLPYQEAIEKVKYEGNKQAILTLYKTIIQELGTL